MMGGAGLRGSNVCLDPFRSATCQGSPNLVGQNTFLQRLHCHGCDTSCSLVLDRLENWGAVHKGKEGHMIRQQHCSSHTFTLTQHKEPTFHRLETAFLLGIQFHVHDQSEARSCLFAANVGHTEQRGCRWESGEEETKQLASRKALEENKGAGSPDATWWLRQLCPAHCQHGALLLFP